MPNQFSSAPLGSQQRSKDLMAAAKKMLSGTPGVPTTSGGGSSSGRTAVENNPLIFDTPAYNEQFKQSGATVTSEEKSRLEKDINSYTSSNPQQAQAAQSFGTSSARQQQQPQVNAFAMNPHVAAGFKSTLDDLQFKLNTISNDPFKAREEKQDDQKSTVNSYTDQLAGLFNNLQELNTALQNPQFQQQVQTFEQQGGDMSQVAEKVQMPQSQFNMSIDEYLGDVDTTAQQQAYQSLFPEGRVAQDQIMMEQGIPEQYREEYFGDAGVYHQMAEQQKEREKLIDKRMIQEAKNARAQADLQMQKMDAQAQIARATTEENRVNAKNYITGQLAKMGALKTTGQAPIAIANLDQKYQAQLTQIDTDFSLAKNQMEIELNDYLRNLELDRDDNILKTREDLTLDQSKMMETIMKAQIDADRRSFKIISDFAGDFRKETDKYQKELDKAASKYTSDYTNLSSAYTLPNFDMWKNNMQNMPSIRQMTEDPVTKMHMDKIRHDFPKREKEANPQEFIQKLISSGKLNSMAEDVLRGTRTLDDYATSNRRKILAEFDKYGITEDMIGGTMGSTPTPQQSTVTQPATDDRTRWQKVTRQKKPGLTPEHQALIRANP